MSEILTVPAIVILSGQYRAKNPSFSSKSDSSGQKAALQNDTAACCWHTYSFGPAEEMGFAVPEPGSGGSYSGRFIQRVPKSLHARLVMRAKHEGVSMNTLVTTVLAESLGAYELRR